MRDWRGEHEFFPDYIESLLENFIPPYLIGDESRSQQPFSASDSNRATRDHFDQISTHTVGLGRELEAILPPTDEHLPDLNSGETQAQTEDENRDIDILPPRSFPDILARHLARFARANMQKRIIPTDDMFQLEARRVIYDCEDSWNQTIADNPDWMDSFRRQFQL